MGEEVRRRQMFNANAMGGGPMGRTSQEERRREEGREEEERRDPEGTPEKVRRGEERPGEKRGCETSFVRFDQRSGAEKPIPRRGDPNGRIAGNPAFGRLVGRVSERRSHSKRN